MTPDPDQEEKFNNATYKYSYALLRMMGLGDKNVDKYNEDMYGVTEGLERKLNEFKKII